MVNRENVIKELECQLDDLKKYADDDEVVTLTQHRAKDILALLKEQKAKIDSLNAALDNITQTGHY